MLEPLDARLLLSDATALMPPPPAPFADQTGSTPKPTTPPTSTPPAPTPLVIPGGTAAYIIDGTDRGWFD